MSRNKWALAVAAGAFTTALIGGVGLAGFQLPAPDGTTVTTLPAAADTSTASGPRANHGATAPFRRGHLDRSRREDQAESDPRRSRDEGHHHAGPGRRDP